MDAHPGFAGGKESLADTTGSDSVPRGWTLRREYRSTYRDSLTDSERLVEGRWWSGDSVPVEISVEQELALDLGVGIGDEIVWDIQGVPLASRVRSIRTVDWARFEPNFFVVFEPGALEGAPHTLVTLTRIERPADRGAFQRRLAERAPNVTTLDLSVVQEALERLVDRVVLAIRFMAAFTLATGTLVLVGALATSRFQRIREGALQRGEFPLRQALRSFFQFKSFGAVFVLWAGLFAASNLETLLSDLQRGAEDHPVTHGIPRREQLQVGDITQRANARAQPPELDALGRSPARRLLPLPAAPNRDGFAAVAQHCRQGGLAPRRRLRRRNADVYRVDGSPVLAQVVDNGRRQRRHRARTADAGSPGLLERSV